MLSIVLKTLFNKGEHKIDIPELTHDTELSLSLIESGCLFVPVDNKSTLIIKSSPDVLEALEESDRILINFELIQRPEFPTLGAYVVFEEPGGNKLRFEYFFNTESSAETELVEMLVDQDHFDIITYDGSVRQVKRTAIGDDKKTELSSILARARA